MENDVVIAWGPVLQVRTRYSDFVGISVKVEKQEGMHFTFPGDIAVCTVEKDADYVPKEGDYVKITVPNDARNGRITVDKVERKPEG